MRNARYLEIPLLCLLLCVAGGLRAEEPAGSKEQAEPSAVEAEKKIPMPVIYDGFSDGRWEKRTGKDPWGRKLPEWELKAP